MLSSVDKSAELSLAIFGSQEPSSINVHAFIGTLVSLLYFTLIDCLCEGRIANTEVREKELSAESDLKYLLQLQALLKTRVAMSTEELRTNALSNTTDLERATQLLYVLDLLARLSREVEGLLLCVAP